MVWSTGGHIERVENVAAVGTHTIDGTWMGVGSTWYLVAFIPKAGGFKLTAAGEAKPDAKDGETGKTTVGVRATPTIAPGQAWEGRVLIYIGPKEVGRLEAHGLEGALNFGGFPVPRKWGGLPMEWLGLPILKFMNWVYRYVGNYYDPFLAAWLTGPAGQAVATQSVTLTTQFSSIEQNIYSAFGIPVADVTTAFQTTNFTNVPVVNLPVNVVTVCSLTFACTPPPVGPNIHPNEIGYGLIAATFAQKIGTI